MGIPRIAAYPMPQQASASRADWAFEPHRAALLVHDLQDYFLDFYDRAAEPVPTLLANVRRLLDLAHASGMPVFYTAQSAQQTAAERGLLTDMWGPGLTAHPAGQPVCADIAPSPGDVVLTKWRYSAFQRSDLAQRLDTLERDQLVVCGVYAHIGVLLSAAEAFMRDVQPFLVADAIADFSLSEHRMALDYVAQRCGRVVMTQALLDQTQAEAHARVDAAGTAAAPATLAALTARVAHSLQLDPRELPVEANLLDWGLDSIRVMALVESWRQAGRDIQFVQLAQAPTLSAWWSLLQTAPVLAR
jgi:bifunctional isochorismate lyase/aryl carrier protein